MKRIVFILALLLFGLSGLSAQEHILVLYPVDGNFQALNNQGKDYLTLAEGNSATLYFVFPGYKEGRIKYLGNLEYWMLGDSTAVGDMDSLGIDIQPVFYDASDDTMRASTTGALTAADANTDQAQLATIANGVKEITPVAYDFSGTTTDFIIHRQADLGLCYGALVTITYGSGGGSIRYKPYILALTQR